MEDRFAEVDPRGPISAAICTLIGFAPAIAAVVIAAQYEPKTSSCEFDDPSYTIELPLFLNLAGYLYIGFSCLAACISCVSRRSSDSEQHFMKICALPFCCLGIFFLVWDVIGLDMYANQMSDDCQEEDIAKMILAWYIIQYACLVLGCCAFLVHIKFTGSGVEETQAT
eukprot:42275_1